MSNLLIDDKPTLFLPRLALALDSIERALVLQQIHWLVQQPHTGKVIDGHKWVWGSYAQWCTAYFPMWKPGTLAKHIRRLEKEGLLISSHFNAAQYDQTKFYRIDYTHPFLRANLPAGGALIMDDHPASDEPTPSVLDDRHAPRADDLQTSMADEQQASVADDRKAPGVDARQAYRIDDRQASLYRTEISSKTTTKTTAETAAEICDSSSSGGPPGPGTPTWRDVVDAYKQEIGLFTPFIRQAVQEDFDALGERAAAWVIDAIKEAARYNVRKWSYVHGILTRWKANGRPASAPALSPPEGSWAALIALSNNLPDYMRA